MYSLLIQAHIDEDDGDDRATSVEFPDMQTFYRQLIYDGIVPDSLPVLRFRMNSQCLQRDFLGLGNVSLAWLCSQRFHDVLQAEEVPCRTYPVAVLNEETDQPVAQRYYLFLPDRIKDAIDLERSEFYRYAHLPERELTKLVLKATVAAREHPLFQADPSIELLVHDRVRARIEAEQVVGVAFAPLETVVNPWLGLKMVQLRQELQQTPGDTAQWYELARLWTGMYRPKEALEAIDQALALSPEMAELWRQRGVKLAELGQDEAAMAAFERAMDLNAADPPGPERPQSARDWAWQGRCELLRKQGRYAEALPLAERGVQMFPRRPDAWYELGMVHLGMGDQEAALEALAQAPAWNWPQNEWIFEHQGAILCQLGRYEEALAVYEQALIFTPYNLTLLRGRLEAFRALGRPVEAEQAEAELHPIEDAQERWQKTRPW